MKHLTDSTLSAIEHARSKLGPLSSVLDKFVERMVPTVTASACSGVKCGSFCDTTIQCNSQHLTYGHTYYSTVFNGCRYGYYTCYVRFCGC
jgi:hypothetical protein